MWKKSLFRTHNICECGINGHHFKNTKKRNTAITILYCEIPINGMFRVFSFDFKLFRGVVVFLRLLNHAWKVHREVNQDLSAHIYIWKTTKLNLKTELVGRHWEIPYLSHYTTMQADFLFGECKKTKSH